MTCQADRVSPPRRSDLLGKHEAIKTLRERPMTDVRRQLSTDGQS